MITQVQIKKIQDYFKNKRKVSYVVLFGSALKHLKKDSDIDLLIDHGSSFEQRLSYAADLEQLVGRRVDVVPVDGTYYDLALQAFAYGKIIVRRNEQRLKEDYFRVRRIADDNLPLERIRRERLYRVLNGKT